MTAKLKHTSSGISHMLFAKLRSSIVVLMPKTSREQDSSVVVHSWVKSSSEHGEDSRK